ncbi:MAG: GAF and ANTAR domain-containing protein [Actinobacteria bacterium]|nr:GAF and ANTAR domain-containing protein [Actinomycetota bacterium]
MCSAAVTALPASGVGVSLMTDTGVLAVAQASDRLAEAVGTLQFTLGEGPCVDAFHGHRPVLVPDLRAVATRWPGYAPAALALGVGAVFSFPLQVGVAHLGALDVHRARPGELSASATGFALAFADVTVEALLDAQGAVSAAADPGGLDGVVDGHYVVYQAQGMTMVDLGVSLVEALVRLRAHAFAVDRPLLDVARDVVEGRLRLEPDTA